jgi:ketosteroid isomerase-like protein
MSSDPTEAEIRDLLARFAAAWAVRDVTAVLDLMCEDGVYGASVGPEPGTTYRGRNEIERGLRAMFAHDDGAAIDQGEPLVAAGRAVTTWTYRFATGRVERGVDVWRFRDGRIAVKDAYRKAAG